MEIVTLLIALAALLISFVSIALQLVSKEVMDTLDYQQRLKFPHFKRRLARCTFLLAALTAPFAISIMFAAPWIIATADLEIRPEPPWWVQVSMWLGILSAGAACYWIILLFRIWLFMGEPDPMQKKLESEGFYDSI